MIGFYQFFLGISLGHGLVISIGFALFVCSETSFWVRNMNALEVMSLRKHTTGAFSPVACARSVAPPCAPTLVVYQRLA